MGELMWAFSKEKREYDNKILEAVYTFFDGELSRQDFLDRLDDYNEEITLLIKEFMGKIRG